MTTAIAAIQQSARTQAQLIDDLLDVSRIVAGKLSLELRATDLASILRAAMQTVAPLAEKKSIACTVTLPPASLYLLGDAARLHQIFTNLLGNAIKFTPAGGTVALRLRSEGSRAVVEVTDSGAGISSSFLPYVFDRFSQEDTSSTREYSGLGLGLAIVQHLVALHGGEVSAHSDGPGQGSRFTVRFPLREHSELPSHAALATEHGAISLSGLSILVVEDEPFAREMLQFALTHYGAQVRAVSSVAEAVQEVKQRRPDVVVTDIAMPGADGFSLLHQLRLADAGVEPRLPVIAVSALARADEKSRIMLAGFDDYIQKPVQPDRLAIAIHRRVAAS